MPSRRRTSRAEMPVIWMALFRLLGPETIVNEERGWPKSSARNSMQASLARPSAGGASTASLSASPVCPTIAIRRALGWTLTLRTIPCRFSRTTATGLFSNLLENMNDSCCRLLCLAHGLRDFVVYGFASVRLWIWLADAETRGRSRRRSSSPRRVPFRCRALGVQRAATRAHHEFPIFELSAHPAHLPLCHRGGTLIGDGAR